MILAYISDLKNAPSPIGTRRDTALVSNVLRSDIDPYPAGEQTAVLLAAAPATDRGYFKVKKILG